MGGDARICFVRRWESIHYYLAFPYFFFSFYLKIWFYWGGMISMAWGGRDGGHGFVMVVDGVVRDSC